MLAKFNIVPNEEIKTANVTVRVDSTSHFLFINQSIQNKLRLPFIEKRKAFISNGSLTEYDLAGPVEINFNYKKSNVNAIVLNGDFEPIFGAALFHDNPIKIPYLKLL